MALTLRGNGQLSADNYGIDSDGSITATGITSTGNAGIGTSSPTNYANYSTLTLNDTNGGVLEFKKGNTQVSRISNANDQALQFVTNGSERMRVDASGRVTTPYQPAFYWTKTSTQTATSSSQVVIWDSSKVNTGNHFNNQRFTAPVAGVYLFQLFTLSLGDTATNDTHIIKNGSTIMSRQRNSTGTQHETTACSAIISLSVNDYVEVQLGAVNDVVYGDFGDGWSGFSGHLIG